MPDQHPSPPTTAPCRPPSPLIPQVRIATRLRFRASARKFHLSSDVFHHQPRPPSSAPLPTRRRAATIPRSARAPDAIRRAARCRNSRTPQYHGLTSPADHPAPRRERRQHRPGWRADGPGHVDRRIADRDHQIEGGDFRDIAIDVDQRIAFFPIVNLDAEPGPGRGDLGDARRHIAN